MDKIRFTCPECGRKLSVSEREAGRWGKCPQCGGSVHIPHSSVEHGEKTPERKAQASAKTLRGDVVLWITVAVFVCSTALAMFFAWAATGRAHRLQDELAKERRAKEEMLADLDHLKEQARQELEAARAESERIIAEAERVKDVVNKMHALLEKKLHEVFGDLRRYQDGTNEVGLSYVDSFTLYRQPGNAAVIEIKLVNRGHREMKPNFELLFLNEYGFITDTCYVEWWFHRVGPGETRIVKSYATFRYGDPVYYTVLLR